jgi:hypothetical protein
LGVEGNGRFAARLFDREQTGRCLSATIARTRPHATRWRRNPVRWAHQQERAMTNTIGDNPDAVQLGPQEGGADRAGIRLTLRLREIGERLSIDEPDAPSQPRQAPEDEVWSPE